MALRHSLETDLSGVERERLHLRARRDPLANGPDLVARRRPAGHHPRREKDVDDATARRGKRRPHLTRLRAAAAGQRDDSDDAGRRRTTQLSELRNSSTENAVSVCSFALPREPSATETRAIVSASGASTTFTKSNGPSVAHWWTTFAPSSSTSRFTSRSRSGFAFKVCTPWAVRVDSMMYVGIVPPRPDSRRLVVVEQRGA